MKMLEAMSQIVFTGPGSALGMAMVYFQIGLMFLAYLIADDFRNGRKVQKRDLMSVLLWPLFLFVCLIIGMAVFSDLTSKNKRRKNGGVSSVLDSLG